MNTKQNNEKPRAAADKTVHMTDADKIDTIRRLEAQRDALAAILKRIIDRATDPMSDGGISYRDIDVARALIAKVEDWPLIETRAFQLKAGAK